MTIGRPAVLKLGGELLQEADHLARLAATIARASRRAPLVVIHGGGREIDAALAQAGIPKQQVEGLRITDEPTLDVVVAVLGHLNMRLVARIVEAGADAVGLTGADANGVPVTPARPKTLSSGEVVDLGRVGEPAGTGAPRLLRDLCLGGYVPVVASIGLGPAGQLFNVNADTMAADVAARLPAARLIIAGGTPGVLDGSGRTLASVDAARIGELIARRDVSAGMIAKLRACADALRAGVPEVIIADGTSCEALEAALSGASGAEIGCTRVVIEEPAGRSVRCSPAGGLPGS